MNALQLPEPLSVSSWVPFLRVLENCYEGIFDFIHKKAMTQERFWQNFDRLFKSLTRLSLLRNYQLITRIKVLKRMTIDRPVEFSHVSKRRTVRMFQKFRLTLYTICWCAWLNSCSRYRINTKSWSAGSKLIFQTLAAVIAPTYVPVRWYSKWCYFLCEIMTSLRKPW